ncbi:MAG: sarcosine oxidase subunit alpha family protein, partial [Firmicutes bacterium]|nr:sarcosine oxidase subunit alpha family protein [Bacillota bacterium]
PAAAPAAAEQTAVMPFWQTPGIAPARQWVDFLHDVTAADIAVAARENFISVEHVKRYTTVGMSIDQGKTSNVNALAILGQATGRQPQQVGTTRFRPPYQPVAIGALAGSDCGEFAQRYRHLPVSAHVAGGAVMEAHGDWLRPAYYLQGEETEQQAIAREVRAARQAAVLFDASSLGKFEVRGPDAAEFLNRIYVNNIKSLPVGRVRYGLMLKENGVILDDGVVARFADNYFLVTTSSAGALAVAKWLEEWHQCEWPQLDLVIAPVTAQWATLTVSGPRARAVLQRCPIDVDISAAALPHLSFTQGHFGGAPLRLFRVSFTGESSFELNVPAAYADALWQQLMLAGDSEGITPLGMEALNRLRIEKGFLEVGVDTDNDTTALDVGWAGAIDKKSADFLGRR